MRKIVLNSIIIIAASITLIMLVFFTDGAQNMIGLIVRTEYRWLMAALGCTFLYWVFGALTVGMIKRGIIGRKNDPGQNFKTVMVGMFFASVTPFATGGQPAQIYMLKRMGVDGGTGTSIIILKSVFYQFSIMFMCGVLYFINKQFLVMNIPQFNILFIIGVCANLLLL
ncbi:MAG: flippase-like domain-containing protein, partial [Clostridia bacterium]|nr:flippase-like domain-containing protein [Clostridia bacterium]